MKNSQTELKFHQHFEIGEQGKTMEEPVWNETNKYKKKK